VGRFISEDTYEGDINDPLTLNLYTYVHNNPLRYTDPSGNMAVPLLRIISNWYNKSQINKKQASTLALISNGFGIYTAFHEIAQLNIAKRLHSRGLKSILEYRIPNTKLEVDVVSGRFA
jgi:hypothetical protein